MRVAISGSSGMVGHALTRFLTERGDSVVPLVRQASTSETVFWDVEKGLHEPEKMDGVDAVVHLAGENIASGRWTQSKKQEIWNSRVQGTRALSTSLAALPNPPKVYVTASGTGFYGDCLDEEVTEDTPAADTFLGQLCKEWELATRPAARAGVRTAHTRFGMIISLKGGALPRMLPAFRAALGGVMGSGRQWVSWVTLEDAVRAIHHCLVNDKLSGPVNVVAPGRVRNRDFVHLIGKQLHRPTFMHVPGFMVRGVLGEMGRDLVLSSYRVIPKRLTETGFIFQWPYFEEALEHIMRDNPKEEQQAA